MKQNLPIDDQRALADGLAGLQIPIEQRRQTYGAVTYGTDRASADKLSSDGTQRSGESAQKAIISLWVCDVDPTAALCRSVSRQLQAAG
jgi:hypothetical protein